MTGLTSVRPSVTMTCNQLKLTPKGVSPIDKFTRLNNTIRASQLRVVDDEGQQLGVMSRAEALRAAEERGLDLVEISPNANPPVAKIIDWGKYNYQRTKQLQKNKRSAKTLDVKQMRFGLKISAHDLGVKLRKVSDFLEAGHKVKITIRYRGRELAHKELGFKLADKIIADYGEAVIVDQKPQMAGKQLNFVVRSNPAGKSASKKQTAESTPSIKGLDKLEVSGGSDAKA